MAQVLGAVAAAAVLACIATGKTGFDLQASGFAANGYGDHSPGKYSLAAAFTAELVLTAGFIFVILGATSSARPPDSRAFPSAWP